MAGFTETTSGAAAAVLTRERAYARRAAAVEPLERRYLFATTVHFTIDPQQNVEPISRFIYGVNQNIGGPFSNLTLTRAGGNRWRAYNWENNASNAGNGAVPAVESVTVNDGSAQRSEVRSLTLNFNSPVTLQPGAITLSLRPAGEGPTFLVPVAVSNPSGDAMTYLVTFPGASGPALENGSLPDGIYDLSVSAALVSDAGGTTMGADYGFTFHRLFGDIDGNKTVNAEDFAQFRNAFGSSAGAAGYDANLDFDGNGAVNALDYGQFKKRFGVTFGY